MANMNKRKLPNGSIEKQVYYITLTATELGGKPSSEYFTFDVASKIDLEDTTVKVLNCHDLLSRYRNRHGDEAIASVSVYEIVEDLIDSNNGGFYLIDECSFPTGLGSK